MDAGHGEYCGQAVREIAAWLQAVLLSELV